MAALLILLPPGLSVADTDETAPRITQVDTSRYPLVDLYSILPAGAGPGRIRSFSVYEGNSEAAVLEVRDLSRGTRDVPVAMSLVVDTSGSMKGDKIKHAREALGTFAAGIPAESRINLISFNQSVQLLASNIPPQLVTGYAQKLVPVGNTALYDAIRRGVVMLSGQPGRKVVVTLTDGRANRGDTTMEEVISLAEAQGVSLLFVGLGDDARRDQLGLMAARTGGEAVFTHAPDQLVSLYQGFARDISREVLVRYRASGVNEQVVPVTLSLATAFGTEDLGARYMSPEATFAGSTGNASWLLLLVGFFGPAGLMLISRLSAFDLAGQRMLLVEGSSTVTRQLTRIMGQEGATIPMSIGGETLLVDNLPSDGTRVLTGGETLTWGETTMIFNRP
jgi:uncharacterized protein YegL